MNVLIACEFSQVECIQFRLKGHNAFSCDIEECLGGHPEWHIKGDVIPLLNGDCKFKTCDNKYYCILGEWDLIIAHPPCTYLSKAGARWMFPNKTLNSDRYKKALAARQFFMMFYNAKCNKIAIENPQPLNIIKLPKESQIIQPYQFGEPYSKKTYLWLKNLPKLKYTNIIDDYVPFVCSNTSGKNKNQKYSLGIAKNSKDRSISFNGISAAMSDQWG